VSLIVLLVPVMCLAARWVIGWWRGRRIRPCASCGIIRRRHDMTQAQVHEWCRHDFQDGRMMTTVPTVTWQVIPHPGDDAETMTTAELEGWLHARAYSSMRIEDMNEGLRIHGAAVGAVRAIRERRWDDVPTWCTQLGWAVTREVA